MPAPWFSPNGRYTVDVNPIEMRMSHWVDCPIILDEHNQIVILDLAASLWSVENACWSEDSTTVTLNLRRYPGRVSNVQVQVNIISQTAVLQTPSEINEIPISQLLNGLESFARSQPGMAMDWY